MREDSSLFIVEDEIVIALDLKRLVENLGFNVVGIENNGSDAIRKIEKIKPDLVLMDIRIKGEIDGIETAKILRQRFNTPVIFLSAYADEKTLERSQETLCYGYLAKPFNEQTINRFRRIT